MQLINDYGQPAEIKEGEYWHEVIRLLNNQSEIDLSDYLFIMHNSNSPYDVISEGYDHPKKVLIWQGCELKLNYIEKLKHSYHHIFANYYWDDDGVTSIPLGYLSYGYNNTVMPMEERLYNLNFVGCLNRNRIKFASELTGKSVRYICNATYSEGEAFFKKFNHLLKSFRPTDEIKFSSGFNGCMDSDKYVNYLRNSKIALCPKGFSNTETFRIYEAARYGCVVISEKLPNREYYNNSPIIQVNNWRDGLKIAEELLLDENNLNELSKKTVEWYEQKLSPTATTKKIIKKLCDLGKK